MTKPRVLMCRGDFFRPAAPHPDHGFSNQWEERGNELYNRDRAGFKKQNAQEEAALREAIARHAQIVELDPIENCPDMVYTADGSASLVWQNGHLESRTVLSKFTNPNRDEAVFHKRAFEIIDPSRILHQSPHNFEGTGDSIYDPYRDCLWVGETNNPSAATAAHGRTDKRAHGFLKQVFGITVHGLPSRQGHYHLDTYFGVLPRGELVMRSDLFTKKELHELSAVAFQPYDINAEHYLIHVPKQDRENFSTNFRCFGNTIIMPECSDEMQGLLKRRGYEVVTVSMTTFHAGGGSVHCCTNEIDQRRVIGGYWRNGGAPQPS